MTSDAVLLTRAVSAALCVLLAAGCRIADVTYADQILAAPETDGQAAPVGARLPAPLAVIVRSNDAEVMPRVRVRWRNPAGAGAGVASDTVTLTDATGRAQVDFTLGGAPGEHTVRAELVDRPERFALLRTLTTEAPVLTSVEPNQFTGGDTVTVVGGRLSATARAEVGGAAARVVSGTANSLRVIIPICLPPGATDVRAWVGGAASTITSGTFVAGAGALVLAPGHYASIDPAQIETCATFPTAGPGGAEYLVAPIGVSGSPGASAAYRIVGDSVVQVTVSPVAAPQRPSVADAFHAFLRRQEGEIARRPRPRASEAAIEAASAMAVPPRVGDQRSFRVCGKLGCGPLEDYPRVDARVRFAGRHVAIYQDLNAPANGFTDAEFLVLGQTFDDVLYDVASRAFGVESDADANDVVNVLLTPVVNGLTPPEQCSTGVFLGFFNALDLEPRYLADPRSNRGEIFYGAVPDPVGAAGCPVAKDRLLQLVPNVFIHEFQHMINFHQHFLVRHTADEQTWLNEALSELAEELGALKLRDLGRQQDYSDMVSPNVYNAFVYLKTPGSHATVYTGAGTLAERGAGWLFMRWLVDNFGTDVTRRLVETPLVGPDNIAKATGQPMSHLLSQWFLANYVSDLPSFTPPPHLSYASWAFRATYEALNRDQPARFDRPFPLVPAVSSGGTFAATGTLRAGSGEYFRVTQTAGQRGFTLRLTDPSGGPLSASVASRLNIIRLR